MNRLPDRAMKADLALLGLPATADRAAVTKAYRRLARMNHPDVCSAPDAALRFEAIENAYRHLLPHVSMGAPETKARTLDDAPPAVSAPSHMGLHGVQVIARPAIIAGPARIEPSFPRAQQTNCDGRRKQRV